MIENKDLMTITEASKWATSFLKKNVTTSNISYLIQYGRIKKYESNGTTKVSKQDLVKYYHSFLGKREINWKAQLGEDVNWALSFDYLKEADTTKHVHRLHPYKGKFIPQLVEYFLDEHKDDFKICKPLFSLWSWWERYSQDTIQRLVQFDRLRTDTFQICLTGDSRTIDIIKSLEEKHPTFAQLVREQKIKGIFSSPPYVGLIDYHEQHAYAYDLFGFERKDELEIGPLFKGKGKEARDEYIQGISEVLRNCTRFLAEYYDVFLVANDKFNMYPTIAERLGMRIVNQYKRPVLNRTEKDKAAYSESIFHCKP
jgi:hypothetical protein